MKRYYNRDFERELVIKNAALFLTRHFKTMKIINCPACESDSNYKWANICNFTYVKCNKCGLVFLNPHPDEKSLIDYYTSQDYLYSMDQIGTFSEEMTKIRIDNVMIPRFKFVERFLEISSWLDIGTGNAEMLHAIHKLKKGKIKIQGVEPSIECVNYAKQNFNIDLIHSDISSYIKTNDLKFDVVSLFGVLEHVSRPDKIVNSLGRKMPVGSYLVLLVPVSSSMSSLLQKSNHDLLARHLTPPSHVTFWNEKAINILLNRNSFAQKGIWKYGQDCFEILYLLEKNLDKEERRKLLKSMSAFQRMIDRADLSDEMIIVAEKKQ
jgi:2-polyprenyl-3-methyl-5-hydroxy-6-metoxy-1,4-benzoquinol methylase